MSKCKSRTACVMMVGNDDMPDQVGDSLWNPANPLPVKCSYCTFPDLDFVAQPYLLAKSISSPAETLQAQVGNFLVRDRVRCILELAVPEACDFFSTADRRNKKPILWWLAVPKTLSVPRKKSNPPFCPKCREPKVWCYRYADEYWAEMKRYTSGGVDVFKSLEWDSRPEIAEDFYAGAGPLAHPERWTRRMLSRDLYFSVRLEQLLKRSKIKGQLVRADFFKDITPTEDDEVWIDEKLELLAKHGLVDTPKPAAGKSASAAQKWFKQFLKRNATKGLKPVDFAAVEEKHKLTLPQDYKDFIATVGPKSFADVCDMEGSTTTVLPPQKLDFKNHRRGQVPNLEGDDAEVDGVIFAANDGGDCFVFDVSAKGGDYPVYWYRHEESTMEPFAPDFAECIKRFAQRN